jgi:hypothetical protein
MLPANIMSGGISFISKRRTNEPGAVERNENAKSFSETGNRSGLPQDPAILVFGLTNTKNLLKDDFGPIAAIVVSTGRQKMRNADRGMELNPLPVVRHIK